MFHCNFPPILYVDSRKNPLTLYFNILLILAVLICNAYIKMHALTVTHLTLQAYIDLMK